MTDGKRGKVPVLWLVMCWNGTAWGIDGDARAREEARRLAEDLRIVAAKYGSEVVYRVVRYVPASPKPRSKRRASRFTVGQLVHRAHDPSRIGRVASVRPFSVFSEGFHLVNTSSAWWEPHGSTKSVPRSRARKAGGRGGRKGK